MPLQIRRGTDAERLAMIQPLAAGELVYVTDSQRLYIGNGSTMGGVAITGYTDEDARDAVGIALETGNAIDTGIVFTKDDVGNRISAQLTKLSTNVNLNSHNITGTGNITISGSVRAELYGSVHADDSTQLVNAQDGTIVLDNTIGGHAIPRTSIVYDLGSTSKRFRQLYLSNNGINIDGYTISSTGAHLDLPAGTTLGGIDISTVGELKKFDLEGSVLGIDSSVIVDAVALTVSAPTVTGGQIRITSNSIKATGALNQINFPNTAVNVLSELTDTAQGLSAYGVTNGAVSSSLVVLHSSRGSTVSPTILQNGDNFGGIVLSAHNGSDFVTSGLISMAVDGTVTPGASSLPTKFIIATANGTDGIFTTNKQMTFDSKGLLTVGAISVGDGSTSSPSIKFTTDGGTDTGFFHDADGVIKVVTDSVTRVTFQNVKTTFANAVVVGSYITSAAPTPVAGMIYFDTTTNHFMGYNGTTWKQLDN